MATYYPKEREGLTPGTGDFYYRLLFPLLIPGARWDDEVDAQNSSREGQ